MLVPVCPNPIEPLGGFDEGPVPGSWSSRRSGAIRPAGKRSGREGPIRFQLGCRAEMEGLAPGTQAVPGGEGAHGDPGG